MKKELHFLRLSSVPFIKMAISLILAILSALANFGLLFLSGWLLTATAIAGLGGIVTQNLFNLFLPASGVRFFATVRILCRYAERLMIHDLSMQAINRCRILLFKHLIPRSSHLINDKKNGDLLTRLVQDTEWSGQFLTEIMQPFATAAVCALLYSIIIALFNLEMGLVTAISQIFLIVVLPLLMARFIKKPVMDSTNTMIELRSAFIETLQMQEDISGNGSSGHLWNRINDCQSSLNQHYLNLTYREALCEQIKTFVILITLCLFLAIGAHALSTGSLKAAQLPMLVLGALASFATCHPLMNAIRTLQQTNNASKRIMDITDSKTSMKSSSLMKIPEFKPSIVLRDIYFAYPRTEKVILDKLDLHLSTGERIGIIGPSGAGKSTLLHGLMRLTDFDAGYAEINDTSLDKLDVQALSNHIGFLQQNPHLFQGTIRSNLAFACPTASETDMWNALKRVHLVEDIQVMPEKLDSPVGNQGINLSGGQRKRLAIAQLILRRPSLLLLDEPCENLPHEMARAVMKDFLEAFPSSTTSVLCICHRNEPLEFMNRVLTLRKGKLFEATNMEKLQII